MQLFHLPAVYRHQSEGELDVTIIPTMVRQQAGIRLPDVGQRGFLWQCVYLVQNTSSSDMRLDKVCMGMHVFIANGIYMWNICVCVCSLSLRMYNIIFA